MKTNSARLLMSTAIVMLFISFLLSGCLYDLVDLIESLESPAKAPPPLTDNEIATLIELMDQAIPVNQSGGNYFDKNNKRCEQRWFSGTFEYRDNKIILKDDSGTIILRRVGTDEYCHETSSQKKCITGLENDSFYLSFYENGELCQETKYYFQHDAVADQNIVQALVDPGEAQPELQPVPPSESLEGETLAEPLVSEDGAESTSAYQFYSWHGPYCDEVEGTFLHTWEVYLMVETDTGSTAGTVKFHNCPGGGRVQYTVTGTKTEQNLMALQGTKQNGGGTLFKDSPESRIFNFDWAAGMIVE